MIRDAVRAKFRAFSGKFEGYARHFYCDVLGLVTIGYGDLIDPIQAALALDYVRPDGSTATVSEVEAAWMTVKNRGDLRQAGGGAYEKLTTIRATEASISRLVDAKLDAFAAELGKAFSDFATWPADAQLGALSMAWAMGPGFPATFPRFTAEARWEHWDAAAGLCHMNDANNPGLRPRNAANVVLFQNAARAQDPDVLYWPADLAASVDVTEGGADKPVPALPDPDAS